MNVRRALMAFAMLAAMGSGSPAAPVPAGNRRRRDQPAEPEGPGGYYHQPTVTTYRAPRSARAWDTTMMLVPFNKAARHAHRKLTTLQGRGARTRTCARQAERLNKRLAAMATVAPE